MSDTLPKMYTPGWYRFRHMSTGKSMLFAVGIILAAVMVPLVFAHNHTKNLQEVVINAASMVWLISGLLTAFYWAFSTSFYDDASAEKIDELRQAIGEYPELRTLLDALWRTQRRLPCQGEVASLLAHIERRKREAQENESSARLLSAITTASVTQVEKVAEDHQ